jgi:hypothetical protein
MIELRVQLIDDTCISRASQWWVPIQEPNNLTITVSRFFGALWKNLALSPIKLLVHFVVILLVFGQDWV